MAPLKPGTQLPPQKLRRNERERKRVDQINRSFDRLRERVPAVKSNKKVSKADTIREAARYIAYLQSLLNQPSTSMGQNQTSMDCSSPMFDSLFDYTMSMSSQSHFPPSPPLMNQGDQNVFEQQLGYGSYTPFNISPLQPTTWQGLSSQQGSPTSSDSSFNSSTASIGCYNPLMVPPRSSTL